MKHGPDPSNETLVFASEEFDRLIHPSVDLHGELNFHLVGKLLEEVDKVLLLLTVVVSYCPHALVIELQIDGVLILYGIKGREFFLELGFA